MNAQKLALKWAEHIKAGGAVDKILRTEVSDMGPYSQSDVNALMALYAAYQTQRSVLEQVQCVLYAGASNTEMAELRRNVDNCLK